MSLDILVYREITYPGVPVSRYLISEQGHIFSLVSKKFLKPFEDKDGYPKISLGSNSYLISRLVAYEYLDDPNLELVVDHIDGNKKNNDYRNLEWVTIRENTLRAERLGLRKVRGIANGNNCYPEELIHDICRLLEQGSTPIEVFRIFRKSAVRVNDTPEDWAFYQLVYKLKKREIWPDVTSQYKYSSETIRISKIFRVKSNSKFTENQVHDICKLCSKGKKSSEILDSLGIEVSKADRKGFLDAITAIRYGETWTYISSHYDLPTERRPKASYDLNDDELFRLIDNGKQPQEIFDMYGVHKKSDNPGLYRALSRRIYPYWKLKRTPTRTNLTLANFK